MDQAPFGRWFDQVDVSFGNTARLSDILGFDEAYEIPQHIEQYSIENYIQCLIYLISELVLHCFLLLIQRHGVEPLYALLNDTV